MQLVQLAALAGLGTSLVGSAILAMSLNSLLKELAITALAHHLTTAGRRDWCLLGGAAPAL
jgi:hypothetical protein